ncbi:hypothetical protein FH972_022258 [Carpinus fangiana]|uniref:Uncharacterized protein n=1 Tax=Carpinus fangiana TaxID=176857 RepID=A0A5N6KRR2_9ROSI|nr:hypothetical protein FH972_022258 [Carpinus fangiana]
MPSATDAVCINVSQDRFGPVKDLRRQGQSTDQTTPGFQSLAHHANEDVEGQADAENYREPVLYWKDRTRHFTWTWFTMTMSTGGLANAMDKVPLRFTGLYSIGVTFFILNITLFIFNCTMMSLRAYYWPKAFKGSFFHPTESLFIPAFFISIATLLINTCEYGLSAGKTGPWLTQAMVVMYWIYVAIAIMSSTGIYLLMWSTQTFTVSSMTPQWIFPAYPLLLVAPFAGVLSRPEINVSNSMALQIIVGGTMVQGAGFCVSFMIYSAYLYRLMTHKLPDESVRPSMFVSVGPSGFTVSGLITMAYNFPTVLPERFMGGSSEVHGQIVKIFGIWMGIWLYGLAVWFFIVSIGAHWSCIGSNKLHFAMTWNAFIFPNTALTSATFAVAKGLDGVLALEVIGCTLTCILVGVWLIVMTMMVRAVLRKQLLWPQKQEDRDVDAWKSDIRAKQLREAGELVSRRLASVSEQGPGLHTRPFTFTHQPYRYLGMAVPNPGVDIAAVPGLDPEHGQKVVERKGSLSASSSGNGGSGSKQGEFYDDVGEIREVEESPVAPDQFDERFETSRNELWAYYAIIDTNDHPSYYIGNNGLTLFNFAPTQFQNLMSQAADPVTGLLPFAGSMRSINSIILLCNGISFAIQVVVFLVLGSYADFGSWRPNILIVLSIVAYGIGFGWLGVHEPEKWHIGAGLYIVGLMAYQTTLTFWTAAFPGLARNSREMREKAEQLTAGEISREAYDQADSLKRSHFASIAFYVSSMGELVILAIIVGIMFGIDVNASTENNTWGLSVLVAFGTGAWVLLSIPWFVLEKRRPGLDPGMNIVLAGMWQLWRAFSKIWRLRQSLCYLIGMDPSPKPSAPFYLTPYTFRDIGAAFPT